MMTVQARHYNEVVINTDRWDPYRWIEAVFYILPQSDEEREQCQWPGGSCEEDARRLHERYLKHFRRCSAHVPLLRLNRSNWAAPFEDVS
jgi:hypothetical protein